MRLLVGFAAVALLTGAWLVREDHPIGATVVWLLGFAWMPLLLHGAVRS